MLSPHFHHRCVFQLSLLTFELPIYKNTTPILRNTIVYGDITIYCNNVKTLRFLTFRVCDALHSVTREPSNRSLPFFHCCTIKHRYTDFWSYLDFHKMQDVPGFRSAGHIVYLLEVIIALQAVAAGSVSPQFQLDQFCLLAWGRQLVPSLSRLS